MKKLKYLIPITLIITVLVTLFVVTNVYAETEGYFTYTVSGGEATITDVDTSISGDVIIPSTLGGYPVTSLGDSAFSSCYELTSINIPDSVTSIGGHAFECCSSLTSVTIGDSVTSIGEDAFYSCSSLTSVTIGNSVTSIGMYAFTWCSSLTSVEIPDSVTSIGDGAFCYCSSLTSVTIPDSVTSIGGHAFECCSSLTSIVIPDSVTSIGKDAFHDCSRLTSITIPDSVTSIGDGAFCYCSSLTSITIPDSVTSIDEYAFRYCSNLTSINIPDSVTSIGGSAFYGCDALTTVYYGGNQNDWDKILISYGNEPLTNANIIFATPDMPIYTISATPEEGGTVTGAGEYEQGTGVTLKATANEGYIFKGWYENGELVSADATITFIAEADRTFTAKFASEAVEIMYGDVNGDGQINMEDVILLRQYIANYNYETGSSTVILGPQQ